MTSLVFDPSNGNIEIAESVNVHWTHTSCVIGNKLHSMSFLDGKIHVYDETTKLWSVLYGVEVEDLCQPKLVVHGENLRIISRRGQEIWAKEFKIKQGKNFVGELLWSELVLDVNNGFFNVDEVISVTL